MYNRRSKCWECGQYDEAVLHWSAESFNRENPQALFIQADVLLAQAGRGKQTADAVYFMEKAAKMGDPKAAYAMGQMFQYGWAVHRSSKTALEWYEKAASLGSSEAAEYLKARRAQKRGRIAAVAVLVCALLVLAMVLPNFLPVDGILVGKDTELIQTTTQEEFVAALQDLMAEYDTDLVIQGEQSTNRLLLKFEGSGIDLSAFPAATVIADEENYLIIQFASEEEAQKCLEALQKMNGVLFVGEDAYRSSINKTAPSDAFRVSNVPYTSPYSGNTYMSWGVEYLGMDRLAEWIKTRQTTSLTVAVIDSGVDPCSETQDRILEGVDFVYDFDYGWFDVGDHGTHVAGIILDATQGLDVTVLPIQIFVVVSADPVLEAVTNDALIVEGLRYAIANSVEVINMSLGGPCNSSKEHESCGSAVDYYVQQALDQDIVVVVAAGNGDEYGRPEDTAINCPAHIGGAITVAACDSNGQLAPFSNYGDAVDVCAPGMDILSNIFFDELGLKNGTSMAAPHISALVAMLKLYLPDRTPAQIAKYVSDYCFNPGDPLYYGEGIPWAGYFAGE